MIADPKLREIATQKLEAEHFNAEVAATLATLVPPERRKRTVEAIVAFEVLYDYLDGLTERPTADPLADGWRTYHAFTKVFDSGLVGAGGDAERKAADDGGYVRELSSTVSEAIASLPGSATVRSVGRRAAERCAAGQIRVHAAPWIGVSELERWAKEAASDNAGADGALGWREYVAGAVASVLAVHALIVLSAESDVSGGEAEAVDAAYLSISAISTMLDSMVDYERDVASGDPWLVRLYGGDLKTLGDRLVDVGAESVSRAQKLSHRAHHLMTLMGVVAYYTSAPEAQSEQARPVVARLHRELGASILPTLAVMRSWRWAKRARRWLKARASRGAPR
jgi:tetraprenyl-beta-curcumene synthase